MFVYLFAISIKTFFPLSFSFDTLVIVWRTWDDFIAANENFSFTIITSRPFVVKKIRPVFPHSAHHFRDPEAGKDPPGSPRTHPFSAKKKGAKGALFLCRSKQIAVIGDNIFILRQNGDPAVHALQIAERHIPLCGSRSLFAGTNGWFQ